MILARVGLEVGQRGEAFRRGHRERRPSIADDPAERALHDVEMVQPLPDCLVGRRRRVRLDRSPVFGVGPGLMLVQIAQQRIHPGIMAQGRLVRPGFDEPEAAADRRRRTGTVRTCTRGRAYNRCRE